MNYRSLIVPILMIGLASPVLAQDKAKIKREPVKNTAADSGAEMFKTYCAACHGQSGTGNGPAASALKKQPADLTQLSKKNGGKFPALRVGQYIEGQETLAAHGSRDMPIWGDLFRALGPVGGGDAQAKLRIHNLTDYVESLQAK